MTSSSTDPSMASEATAMTPTTSTSATAESVRMPRRMRRGPRQRLHLPGDSVESRLSQKDGRAPATWHFEIYNAERGCFARSKMVLEDLLAANERERALMLMGQLTALFHPQQLDAHAAVHAQDVADAREDLSQADVTRTPDWIR